MSEALPQPEPQDLTVTPEVPRPADAKTASAWPGRRASGPPPAEPPEQPPGSGTGSGSGFRAAAHVWRRTSRLVRAAELDTDLRAKGTRLGRYELGAPLGKGGCGTVYEAWDPRHERKVALKLFARTDAQGLERFDREVKVTARLRHPGIVTLLDSGVDEGQPYLVTELVTGVSFDARIERGGLSPDEAARILRDVARAVAHAHAEGVLHRDLKPSNVLLDREGRPHVADFGLALLLDRDTRLTQTGAALGTPAYMPPEQVDARRRSGGARSDVYALGATLYQALTGAPPFDGDSMEALFAALSSAEPRPPRELAPAVPADLETICLRCLEKAPEARYPSCEALAEDLERFIRGEPVLARRPGPAERAVRWVKRHPGTTALAAALACALVVVVWEAVALRDMKARVVPAATSPASR